MFERGRGAYNYVRKTFPVRSFELTPLRTDFIRLSLATCLLLAGCVRGDLVGHGMVMESEVLQLPSRFAPNIPALL
jgi:hypothetical protein